MKKVLLIMVIIISSVVIISISGCAQRITENLVEKAIENVAGQEGENVDVDLQSGEVNITDEEGNEISIGGTKIPDDWPSSVPVNKDIQILFSGSQKTEGKMLWNLGGDYSGSGEDLYNYYKSELSGWNQEVDSVSNTNQVTTISYQVSNDAYVVSALIIEDQDGAVSITLTVNEK